MTLRVGEKKVHHTTSVPDTTNKSRRTSIGKTDNTASNFKAVDTYSSSNKECPQKKGQTTETIATAISALDLKLKAEDSIKFLASANNLNESEVLSLDNYKLQDLVNHVKKTINAMKEDGINDLSPENIQYQARKYSIVIQNGWDSIESFRNANQKNNESITQRLERIAQADFDKPFNAMNKEEQAEVLYKYFVSDFEFKGKLKSLWNDTKRFFGCSDKTKEEFNKELKIHKQTDFVKLLHNSSEEEFLILKDVIEYLDAENRLDSAKDILKSFKQMDDAIKFAEEHYNYDFVEKVITKEDSFGARPTDDYEELVSDIEEIRSYHGEEATLKYEKKSEEATKDFYNNNSQLLKDALKKQEQGEALSKEESFCLAKSAFLSANRDAAPGAVLLNKNNFSEDVKTSLMSTIHEINKSIATTISETMGNESGENFLKERAIYLSQNIEKIAKESNISVCKIESIVNKATNGEYTKTLTKSSFSNNLTTPNKQTNSKTSEKENSTNIKNTDNSAKTITKPDISNPFVRKKISLSQNTENQILEKILTILERKDVCENLDSSKVNNIKNNIKKRNLGIEKTKTKESSKTEILQTRNKTALIEKIKTDGVETAKNLTENMPEVEFVKLILDNDNQINDSSVIDFAIEVYENMNPSRQKTLLTQVGNKGLNILLNNNHTSEKIILSMEGETFTNFYATDIVDKKVDEIKKDTQYKNQYSLKNGVQYA